MSSKTQQDNLGMNVEESSFSVQTKATKAFRAIKAETGKNNLDNVVFDPNRNDVAVWSLAFSKFALDKGIGAPLDKERVCITETEARRVRGIQSKVQRDKSKRHKSLAKLQTKNEGISEQLKTLKLLKEEIDFEEMMEGMSMVSKGRSKEEIGEEMVAVQEKMAEIRSAIQEDSGGSSASSSGDELDVPVMSSMSKYKTPGRTHKPRGDDDPANPAISKDDEEATLLGVHTREQTEKEKVCFMKKYHSSKPKAAKFESFHEQVVRAVAWKVLQHALKLCSGLTDVVAKGDVYSLMQWVVLNFHIVSFSKDDQLMRKVMELRITAGQSFTEFITIAHRDFENIQRTKIGAGFTDDYLKHMIVTGVKGDRRFKGELQTLERENADLTRIVMRLTKVEKEGKLEHAIEADAARAVVAQMAAAKPTPDPMDELRATVSTLAEELRVLKASAAGPSAPTPGHSNTRDPMECRRHARWGACPYGARCNFKHSGPGDKGATKVPEAYLCFACKKQGHWKEHCNERQDAMGDRAASDL
jgi:hypothetical protein